MAPSARTLKTTLRLLSVPPRWRRPFLGDMCAAIKVAQAAATMTRRKAPSHSQIEARLNNLIKGLQRFLADDDAGIFAAGFLFGAGPDSINDIVAAGIRGRQ